MRNLEMSFQKILPKISLIGRFCGSLCKDKTFDIDLSQKGMRDLISIDPDC